MIDTNFPSHYFYIVYLQSTQINSIADIIKLFPTHENPQVIHLETLPGESFTYLRIELNRAYGSESVTQKKEDPTSNNPYLYDLYIGKIYSGQEPYYYIAYPYAGLGKILDDRFKGKVMKSIYKPSVPVILTYMQERGQIGLTSIERENKLNIDITKYSAEVTEASANRINISGSNPLNSRVFDLLNKDSLITLKPISLKLRCKIDDIGIIELAFDKLGNMKFWLRQDEQQSCLSVLPTTLGFFSEVNALKKSPYINSVSLLEDE